MIARGTQRQKGSARRGRYATPEPLPPDPRFLQHYLHAAQPDRPEAMRAEAIRNLLWLHENTKLTGVAAFQLHMFVDDLMTEVWSSYNPETAMNRILNEAPKRGRPRKNAHGDFIIAADVAERMRKDMTRDSACEEVALLAHLERESVRNIYYRVKRSQGLLLDAVVADQLLGEQQEHMAQGADFVDHVAL